MKKLKKQIFISLFLLMPLVCFSIEKVRVNNDLTLFQGIKAVQFFFLPNISAKNVELLNNFAIESLKKMGKVIPKTLDIQNPIEGLDDPNSFFKSPSLTYTIKKIEDIEGNIIPISMATLVLTGGVTLDRRKDCMQADLWKKQCFIQLDLDKDPDQAFKKTFSFLLNEFNKDLLRANKQDANQMACYFAK